jgi:hypothetical protein
VYISNVSDVSKVCEMFHTDVAKVDRDVAMVCTRMLQASVPNISSVFRHMLQVCLSGCYICFSHILQVFY